jgi:hypothetical protein
MMKNSHKLIAILLAVASLFCMTGFTANAATATAKTASIFDGYTVTVLDKATPAVDVRGRASDRNVMCFVSAADGEVGVISYSDYNAMIQKYRRVVNLPGGGFYGTPPVEGKSWEEWFADAFNQYRALDGGSREAAVKTHTAETIAQYR